MKKSLIFWFAAATCAAWILVGCEQEPETKTDTVTKYVAGDITGLNKLLDEGVSPIRYVGNLEIDTNTVFIPAGVTVNVDGGVTLGATGKFIVVGNLNLGAGENITVTGAGLVVGSDTVLAKVTGGAAVTGPVAGTVAEATAAFTTESVVLVTGAVSGAALDSTAVPSGKTLYVANTLTLAAAPAPAGSVIPLGTVSVTAPVLNLGSVVDDTPADTKLTLTGATLTTTAAANVTLPATVEVRAIDAAAGKLTVAGAATSLTVGSLTGTLALPAAVTAVTIGGGAGNVEGAALTTSGAVTLNNTGTAAFSGAVSLGGDLTVTGTATLGSTLTNTAAATATFNGTTTTGAVTTSTGALTIAGKGAVTLGAVTTASSANLVVTNETGVTIPTANIVVSTKIDASAGKVIFGTADNSATIVKGTLTSGANGTASAAVNGVITLTYESGNGASLVLADEGSITFAGTGNLKVAASDSIVLSGGSFTNDGAVLTLTPGATAATATLTGTTLTKLTLGAGATIAIPAEASTGLVLQGVIADLSTAGQITIVQNGVLVLGYATSGSAYVGGIITKYNDTGSVVVAGGSGSGDIADADNVTAFNSKADYDAIVTEISTGVGMAGVITAGAAKNNTIDRNDTFALDETSPALAVTSVAN